MTEDRDHLLSQDIALGVLKGSPEGTDLLFPREKTLVLNADGIVLSERAFQDEIIGKALADIWPVEDREMVRAAIDGAATGQKTQIQSYCSSATGAPRWYEARFERFAAADGAPLQIACVLTDITERKRSEQALREVEARLGAQSALHRQVVDSAIDTAIIGTDADGRVMTWSAGACGITGWTEQETVGRPLGVIFTPEDRAEGRPQREMRIADETGRASDKRWHLKKDGSRFYAHGSVTPLHGPTKGYVKSFRDASDEHLTELALNEARMRLELTLSNAQIIGTWDWDLINDHFQPDERFIRLYGIDPAHAASGAPFAGFLAGVYEADHERVRAELDHALATGEPFAAEYRIHGSDDSVRYVLARGQRILDAQMQPVRFPGVVVDITERTRVENDLRRLAAQLSEVDRRKTEFLSTLAHELRNPLAPLRNGLQILALAAGSPVTATKVREMMARQLTHLVRLVDDLLDIARVTSGKVELKKEQVELQRLIANAIEMNLPLIEAARHKLTTDIPKEPLLLDADPTRLVQVVGNLLDNAAKYTPAGGRIELSVRTIDGDVEVSVTDSGVGIPAEALSAVFDMFNQVGRDLLSIQGQGNLGIGLSLVRRLVELHGGTVRAASPGLGKGSTFIVRLPLAPSDPHKRSTAATASATDRNKGRQFRVLIVDDNVDAAESLSMLLQLCGHTSRVATDGHHALQIVQEFRPDVVFLDIGMPRMNGYEVARAIRTTPGMKPVMLVALTGWGGPGDRARSSEAGFDEHLTKPAELADIETLLSKIALASVSPTRLSD